MQFGNLVDLKNIDLITKKKNQASIHLQSQSPLEHDETKIIELFAKELFTKELFNEFIKGCLD